MYDSTKALKNELRNYYFNKKKLKAIRDKIEVVEYDMTGVKGINSNGAKGSTNPQKKADKFYKLSKLLEELETERNRLELNINYVHRQLLRIKDKQIRQAVIEMYAENVGIRELCLKYSYSKSGLFKKIEKELKDIQKPEGIIEKILLDIKERTSSH